MRANTIFEEDRNEKLESAREPNARACDLRVARFVGDGTRRRRAGWLWRVYRLSHGTMILAVAVLIAVGIALMRGGSLKRLADVPLKAGWIALVAFGLQVYLIYFPETVNQGLGSPRAALLAISYLLLFIFVARNRALPGMAFIGAGMLANFSVMLLNGGYMPITPEALEQVGHTRKVMSAEPGARVIASKDIVLPREATIAWWL